MTSAKKENSSNEVSDLEQDEKLQAVLLADHSFGSRTNGGGPSSQPQHHASVGLDPLSSDEGCHPVLCPLNNVPIIDYILDFLISNGVVHVIVITASDVLEQRLQQSLKGGGGSSSLHSSGLIDVQILKDSSLTNAGDALRELYKRNWIRSPKMPFLLVSGDVITNMNLHDAMAAHRARHAKDSAAIMTVVLKPVAENAGALSSSIVPTASDLCVGLVPVPRSSSSSSKDNGTKSSTDQNGMSIAAQQDYRIFFYSNDASKSDVQLPCTFLVQSQAKHVGMDPRSAGGIALRFDLLETGVAICSLDVLGKFEDEFDYLDIANDFIAFSAAEEEEGLQSRIYAHVLPESYTASSGSGGVIDSTRSYAARAVDFRTYHAISQDLLQRWAYPLAPDHKLKQRMVNNSSEDKLYKLLVDYTTPATRDKSRKLSNDGTGPQKSTSFISLEVNRFQYKECLEPSKVGRSTVLHGPGMMGSSCHVGEECLVQRSVLGDSVRVGNGVHIIDSHIWHHAVVEDNVSITSSVLASGCLVRRGAVIARGCVIGQGCIIDEGVHLAEFTRVTLLEPENDGFDDDYDSGFGDSVEVAENNKTTTTKTRFESDHEVVGPNGKGRVWSLSSDDDDDDTDDDGDAVMGKNSGSAMAWTQIQSIGGNPRSFFDRRRKLQDNNIKDGDDLSHTEGDNGFGELTESEAFSAYTDGAVTFEDTGTSGMKAAGASVVYGRQKGVDVVKEFREICLEFDDEGSAPMENLAIELNSYKFSQNATYSDVTKGVTLAIVQKLQIMPEITDGRLIATLKSKLEFWAPLLQKLSIGIEEEQGIIHGLEAAAIDGTEVSQRLQKGMTFRFLLQTLHDEDILSEDAILAWAEERKKEPDSSPTGKLFQTQPVQDFLEWLEDDDGDDDDDDSEDDSD
mmetsp:Transcript_9050/g.22900  ORF Transcript_9050/g.22900 Transcript_9050/m.22900 type:complete len:907 (-) Transcript_9050:52-2772(-)